MISHREELELLRLPEKIRTEIIDHIKFEIPKEGEIIIDKDDLNWFQIYSKDELNFKVSIQLTCECGYTNPLITLLIRNVMEGYIISCRCGITFDVNNKLKTFKTRPSNISRRKKTLTMETDYSVKRDSEEFKGDDIANKEEIERKCTNHSKILIEYNKLFTEFSNKRYHKIKSNIESITSQYEEFFKQYKHLRWLQRLRTFQSTKDRLLQVVNDSKNIKRTPLDSMRARVIKKEIKKRLPKGMKLLLSGEFLKALTLFEKTKSSLQHVSISDIDMVLPIITEKIDLAKEMIRLLYEGKILSSYNKIEQFNLKRKYRTLIKEYEKIDTEIKTNRLENTVKDMLLILGNEITRIRKDKYNFFLGKGDDLEENRNFRRAKKYFMLAREISRKIKLPRDTEHIGRSYSKNIDTCDAGAKKQKIQSWVKFIEKSLTEGNSEGAEELLVTLKRIHETIPEGYKDESLSNKVKDLKESLDEHSIPQQNAESRAQLIHEDKTKPELKEVPEVHKTEVDHTPQPPRKQIEPKKSLPEIPAISSPPFQKDEGPQEEIKTKRDIKVRQITSGLVYRIASEDLSDLETWGYYDDSETNRKESVKESDSTKKSKFNNSVH